MQRNSVTFLDTVMTGATSASSKSQGIVTSTSGLVNAAVLNVSVSLRVRLTCNNGVDSDKRLSFNIETIAPTVALINSMIDSWFSNISTVVLLYYTTITSGVISISVRVEY